MSLVFDFHPAALGLAVLFAGLLAWWMYRRSVPKVVGLRRGVLTALRFLTLAIVLFLLANPLLRRILSETKRPVVAVLLDDSQSMTIDPGSGQLGVEDVRSSLLSLSEETNGVDLRIFTFGSGLAEAVGVDPDSLRFEASRTDIAGALQKARERLREDNLQGVVLVSDGRYNTGRNPSFLAQEYPVPIHTIVVGDTLRHRDIQIQRITTNDVAYVNAELPVRVAVRSEGFGGQRVEVGLFDGATRIDGSHITLPQGAGETTVDLNVVPQTEGLKRYNVSVTQLPGEITGQNNRTSLSVRVLQRKVTLLVLAGGPSPDVAALRQYFESDDEIDVETFTQRSANTYYEGNPPSALSEYGAIVLIGFPGRHTSADFARAVAAASRNGTPVLFVLDRGTNLSLLSRSMADVLPVRPRTIRNTFVEVGWVLTPAGRTHPILDVDVLEGGWGRLPPVSYNQSRWEASPDARTLAAVSQRGVSIDDPLLVVRSRSRVRTAAILASGMWRWRNLPGDLDELSSLWPDLMSNAIQWITTREDARPVRVAPVRDLFDGSEAVQFSGQVYDESLNPIDGAAIELAITGEDGTRFDYTFESIGNGRYQKNLGGLAEGAYSYRASATRDGVAIGTDRGEFAVGALRVEFQETTADAGLMRQIARRSGGQAIAPSLVAGLLPGLADSGQLTDSEIRTERDEELRRWYLFLGVILVLLTAEWVLRKRSGMV